MLYGKKDVIKWFDTSKKKYWTIYRFGESANGANVTLASEDGESVTHEQNRQMLNDALTLLNGRYDIVAHDSPKRVPKGDWKESFELNQHQEHNNNIGSIPATIQGFSQEDVDQKIKNALKEYKREQEFEQTLTRLKELEKENKELQKNDPWNKIGEIALPLLTTWVGNKFPQAQVAGIPPESTTTPTNEHLEGEEIETITLSDDEQNRLSNVISILHTIAPDVWLRKLEKLAAMVQSNPSMLNMIN